MQISLQQRLILLLIAWLGFGVLIVWILFSLPGWYNWYLTEFYPSSLRTSPLPITSSATQDNWEISVSEVLRGDEAFNAIIEEDYDVNEAPEGYQYVLIRSQLTYNGKDTKRQRADRDLDINLTGSSLRMHTAFAADLNNAFWNIEVEPKTPTETQLAFIVPQDEQHLMLHIGSTLMANTTQSFIAIDEGASIEPDRSLRFIRETLLGYDRPEPAAINETLVTKNWELNVLEVKRGDEALDLVFEANPYNYPPSEGMEYIALRVRLRSIATGNPDQVADASAAMLLTIKGFGDIPQPMVVGPFPYLDSYLYPGGEIEAWTIMQVPHGAKNILLEFEPPLSKFEKRYIRIP